MPANYVTLNISRTTTAASSSADTVNFWLNIEPRETTTMPYRTPLQQQSLPMPASYGHLNVPPIQFLAGMLTSTRSMGMNSRLGDIIAHPEAPDTHWRVTLWEKVWIPDHTRVGHFHSQTHSAMRNVPQAQAAPGLLVPRSYVEAACAVAADAQNMAEVVPLDAFITSEPGEARRGLIIVACAAHEAGFDHGSMLRAVRTRLMPEDECVVTDDNFDRLFHRNPFQINWLGPLGDMQPAFAAALADGNQRRAAAVAERRAQVGVSEDVIALLRSLGGSAASAPAQRRIRA